MNKIYLSLACCILLSTNTAQTHEAPELPEVEWSFSSLFGTFKRDQLQRGFQVYKEVCSACHGVKRVAYRNLSALGFSKAEIKAIAAGVEVEDGPDAEGKMFMRKGLPKDYILGPYPNENVARAANNGALPPDFSLIIKARNGGPRYVYGILTGYKEPPKTMLVDAGRYYNLYYPGHMIAMPPPLHDKGVVYTDGTVASVDQMAKDVVAFLSFAAEPELEERKQLGIKVILYLMLTTVLFYFTMRRIWKRVH